jgi:arginine decarboxylase
VMTPADAYTQLVRDNVKSLCLDDMMDRVPAVMVVPYPPGIPVIMPGEKFTCKSRVILDYLGKVEEFEYQFPGFESDIHGVKREESCGSKKRFKIFCLERETDGWEGNEEDA